MRPTLAGALLISGALLSGQAFAQAVPRATTGAGSPAQPAQVDARAKVAPPPQTEPLAPAVRFTIAPEWGYRVFRDVEEGSTDKRYTSSGVFGLAGRIELYPLAFVTPAVETLRDFGLTGSYSRALGLKSRDVDTDTEVETQWYQFSFGMRYRMLGGKNPLAMGVTAGVQRWVFDFVDTTLPPSRPIAIGRYTMLPVGVDARYSWGRFSVFGDGRFLLPLTISPPGDRSPSGLRWGTQLTLAAAFRVFDFLEGELRGAYTLISYSIPSGMGDLVSHGTVYDSSLVFSAGVTVIF